MLEIKLVIYSDNVIGVKETLADYLEKFGDIKIVEVKQIAGQMRIEV